MTSFGGIIGVSTVSIDNTLLSLSQQDPSSWECPYCRSKSVAFTWIGKDKKDILRFALKLKQSLAQQ